MAFPDKVPSNTQVMCFQTPADNTSVVVYPAVDKSVVFAETKQSGSLLSIEVVPEPQLVWVTFEFPFATNAFAAATVDGFTQNDQDS